MAVPEQPLVPGPMGGPLEWMEGMAYGGLEAEDGGDASAEEDDEERGRSLVPYAGRGRDGRSRVGHASRRLGLPTKQPNVCECLARESLTDRAGLLGLTYLCPICLGPAGAALWLGQCDRGPAAAGTVGQ